MLLESFIAINCSANITRYGTFTVQFKGYSNTLEAANLSHSSYDDREVYAMSSKWCRGTILRWLSIASLRFLIRWPGVSRLLRLYNSNRVGGWAGGRVGVVEADQRPIPRKQPHRQ